MKLNKLIIETRVRNGWSSIDLGIVIGKRFWLRGFLLYLLMAAPIFLASRYLIQVSSVLPFLVLWWCKPLFERPILFFLSRELFSEPMGFINTLSHYREWVLPGLGWILSIRRLSVVRAMTAPITLLERPESSQYTKRASVLGRKFSSEATWLTVVMYHLEGFIFLALFVLLLIFFPDQINFNLAWLSDFSGGGIYSDLAFIFVMAVIAPFYVAAGFMLYISRRVELEGWDIEICFREWMADYKEIVPEMGRSEKDNTGGQASV
jgi:hypothetical protein